MKQPTWLISFMLVTLTFCGPVIVAAQQSDQAVSNSLNRIGRELKKSVATDYRQRYARRTYVRLQLKGGCNVRFDISEDPPSRNLSEPNTPAFAHPFPYVGWSLNLSDLDPAGVKTESPANEDYKIIRFITLDGKEVVKWEDFRYQKVGWQSSGWIEIGEENAAQVVAALEQAIIACKE